MRTAFRIAVLLALAAAPAAAEPVSAVTATYNVDVGPVTLTVVNYGLDAGRGTIRSEAQIRSQGISRIFAEYTANVTGESRAAPSDIAPVRFYLMRERDDEVREARVNWTGGGINYEPRENKPDRRARIDRALNDAVSDPMTAVLRVGTAGETPCPSVHRVFDGRDVFELSLTDKGAGRLKIDGYRGPVRKCEVSWTPIAGRAADKNEPRDSYDVAFAKVGELPSGQAFWLPVLLTGKLKGLRFKAYVTELSAEGAVAKAASQ